MQSRTASLSVPGILALVGGLMVAGGSFLDWFGARFAGVNALSVSGTAIAAGKLTVVLGVVAAVIGAAALAGALSDRRGALVALVFVGCLALAAAAFSAASARQRVADAAVARVASQAGVDEAQARAIVDQALRLSGLAISIEAGLFVVVGGGALTAAAGALPLLASRPVPPSDRADDASPTPGPAE